MVLNRLTNPFGPVPGVTFEVAPSAPSAGLPTGGVADCLLVKGPADAETASRARTLNLWTDML